MIYLDNPSIPSPDTKDKLKVELTRRTVENSFELNNTAENSEYTEDFIWNDSEKTTFLNIIKQNDGHVPKSENSVLGTCTLFCPESSVFKKSFKVKWKHIAAKFEESFQLDILEKPKYASAYAQFRVMRNDFIKRFEISVEDVRLSILEYTVFYIHFLCNNKLSPTSFITPAVHKSFQMVT